MLLLKLKHILDNKRMNQYKTTEDVLEKFRTEKVMTIRQIADCLKKSIPTARNRLKQWKTVTSYDNNGRYYVLADIAKFDTQGLWSYKEIHFSKFGNLKNTLTHVVENSQAGLDGISIGKLLGLDPRSFLSHFRKLSGLRREKISGRYVYFSSNEKKYLKQVKVFLTNEEKKEENSISDTLGIAVLVEKIKHPELSVEKLAKRLKNRGVLINSGNIHAFFLSHGLEKKTPDLPS